MLDEEKFRNTIVWLEDQKIRRYKIEEREALRSVSNIQWEQAFKQYLNDLDCPYTSSTRPEILDWLLGLAIQLEFNEKPDYYSGNAKTPEETNVSLNPLDSLDCKLNFIFINYS